MQKDKTAEAVRSFIVHQDLVHAKDTVVVGVSGGADSVCLFHILVGLREKLDITIRVTVLLNGLYEQCRI